LNEFIGIVEKHTGMVAKVRQLPDQAGDVPYTCASVEKARTLLGYEATVSFDEGIRRTVEWYNGRMFDKVAVTRTLKPAAIPREDMINSTLDTKACGLSRCVSTDAMAHLRSTKRNKIR
jgi:hypothetical protein